MDLSKHRLKMRYFSLISFVYISLLFLWSLRLLPSARLLEFQQGPVDVSAETVDFSKVDESIGRPLGKLGELMISMLPVDLPFTVFVPSEEAFRGVLRLSTADSLLEPKLNETTATLSLVVGFSAVPWRVASLEVPQWREEMELQSVSGFWLYAHRDAKDTLVVNGVPAVWADMVRGLTTIHIINGVLMDAEFEQSFPSNEEDSMGSAFSQHE